MNVGDAVIDSFREILTQIEPVTTSTQRTATKRHPNIKKPDNWRDIYRHYQIYKDASLTIDKFGLLNLHPNHDNTLFLQ